MHETHYREEAYPIIRIRPYRYSDTEEIHELFRTSMTSGDGSPRRAAMRARWSSPLSYALYATTALGFLSYAWFPSIYSRYIGLALSIFGLSTICIRLYSLHCAFIKFRQNALTGDLGNIADRYGMVPEPQTEKQNGHDSDYLVSKSKNCFWVAEAVGELEGGKPEVVGYVGIDVNANSDETSAELRRLVVSPKCRRRGIAGQLIKVSIAHARLHNIKSIYLTTSAYHTSAIDLYRKFGWVLQRQYVLLRSIDVVEMNLDLSASIL
ncbi:hypothetical protein GALMADRAFT_240645 [Galerina marginata CBS 339.88]|uniref:N-acetyltransferase domain-containing protein n=1 Tax=Galerina marginata (strain CBS 339.88) TaxID=685588 RepID=A0A067TIE6_GALM3|nr:hypothetical protein GALMADRAFT_240645 [Galerina marginata CBS 339.88]